MNGHYTVKPIAIEGILPNNKLQADRIYQVTRGEELSSLVVIISGFDYL